MSTYIDPSLITDETAAAEGALAGLADRLNAALDLPEGEEWEAQEGSPETSLGESVGIVAATAAALVVDQARTDYSGFAELFLGESRKAAAPASSTSRWTFSDPGAHSVDDGSEMILDAADGTPVAFATVGDVTFTGLTVDIPVVAVETGTITNGLSGAARDFQEQAYLTSVTLLAPSTGGADEESRDDFLARTSRSARRIKKVPIVTDDYADAALDHPSVAAAVAVRLLDLSAPTDPPSAVGHVSIFVRGFAPGDLDDTVKTEVAALMMGEDRPLAVTAHVGDPTRTAITVAVQIRTETGADDATVQAAVQAAISAAYDETVYGIDDDAPGRWRVPRTTAERTINAYDVAALIDDIPGLDRIESVTLNGSDSVALTGWAPLPSLTAPATVTVLT